VSQDVDWFYVVYAASFEEGDVDATYAPAESQSHSEDIAKA
jgi:hypothetical protein